MAATERISDASRITIGKQIVLPWSKAVEISVKGIKVRLGRSLITMSGIVLAIAFLMSIWTNNSIVVSLREANDADVNLLLQQKRIQTGPDADTSEEDSKNAWLVALSLLVCLVGIANAMLMSVTERFREIGTMKCLGALDSFIVKLFLLESMFQGLIGTIMGVITGFSLSLLLSMVSFGDYVFEYFPEATIILRYAGWAILIGFVVSFFGAILPSYRAAKMEPADAMRTEV